MIPEQEVEHYCRIEKKRKTGPVSEVELSIKDKDFNVIVGALAASAAETGVMTIKLDGFSFDYKLKEKELNGRKYKVLDSAIPNSTEQEVSVTSTEGASDDVIPDF